VARRRYRAFLPLAVACVLLSIAARFQEGASEAQLFFARISPAIERLQRMRAPYSWISEWWRAWLPHYLVLGALSLLAAFRIRKRTPDNLRLFLVGLPLIGLLTVPLSCLLLEGLKWSLMPQVQPMRALLFVTVMAQFSAAAAGITAAPARRYLEACAWFALVYLVPLNTNVTWMPSWNRALAVVLLAVAAAFAVRWTPACLAVAAAAFFLVPGLGRIALYPRLHTPALEQLSGWARSSTPRDAVFLFADAGKGLQPGIFRSEALRAIYVDWKGGGQVNYLTELGEQWWTRWQQVTRGPFDPRALGIDYIVRSASHPIPGKTPDYRNATYLVYRE